MMGDFPLASDLVFMCYALSCGVLSSVCAEEQENKERSVVKYRSSFLRTQVTPPFIQGR